MTLPAHIASRIDTRNSPHGCWLWTGALDRDGFGRVRIGILPRRERVAVPADAVGVLASGHQVEPPFAAVGASHGEPLTAHPGNLVLSSAEPVLVRQHVHRGALATRCTCSTRLPTTWSAVPS